MNILLWAAQIALALQAVAGGAYKIFMFDEITNVPAMSALPRGARGVIGAFEVVCGILLIVPAATNWMPKLTPLAAAALALESLALAALYARYSLALTATNPLVFVVMGAVMAAFVAYGRHTLVPA
jgi:hypothetical protein